MNMINKLISVAVVSGSIASVAFAQPHLVKVAVDCPDISTQTQDKVINYGAYIAGNGIERVNSDSPTSPLFQGPTVPGANIPVDLVAAGYDSDGVSYNSSNGVVTCYFKSNLGYDPFSISYLMVNAVGGTITSSGHEQIKIKLLVGLK